MNRIAASLILALPTLTGFAQDKLYLAATETEALLAKEGQKVVVHGETKGSGKSASGTNFVNFKDAVFFLVTFKSDLGQFPDGEPADAYEGKRIAVEGAVSIYQGKPQIKLTDPKQLTVLAPDAVFPPPAETKETPAAPAKPAMEKPAPGEAPATEAPKRKPPVDPSKYFKKKE
jgi:hypothetical protein